MTDDRLLSVLDPLVRSVSWFSLHPVSDPARLSPIGSHFGGQPYLEAGEDWPECKACGERLDFVCQIRLADALTDPPVDTQLLAFYCCMDCLLVPPPFAVMTHATPAPDRAVPLSSGPSRRRRSSQRGDLLRTGAVRPCAIEFESSKSLPGWEWIEEWCPVIEQVCSEVSDEDPRITYENAVEALVGKDEPTSSSHAGGYPHWIQTDETPPCTVCGGPTDLVLQVGSDEETGLLWIELGAAYLFTCRAHPTDFQLELQFH